MPLVRCTRLTPVTDSQILTNGSTLLLRIQRGMTERYDGNNSGMILTCCPWGSTTALWQQNRLKAMTDYAGLTKSCLILNLSFTKKSLVKTKPFNQYLLQYKDQGQALVIQTNQSQVSYF